MKVLHINQSDLQGGAAIANYRLHRSLLARGIDSRLLVGHKTSSCDEVSQVILRPQIERQLFKVTNKLGLNYIHLVSSFRIKKHSLYIESDVLNFHNLHTGYFNYLAVPTLTREKPAVYTLHDMWSFTGHCTYSFDCKKWETGCGACPYPETYPGIQRDNTKLEWKLKNMAYHRSRLSIVAPSKWLADQAKKSMLSRFEISHIPNGIDTTTFFPINKEQSRGLLGISREKRILMFGAENLSDPRKGADLLVPALAGLSEKLKKRTVLLTIGRADDRLLGTIGVEHVGLGYLTSDRLKAIAFSAADVFVFPTKADNLPLVLQESMACGTPMVSFDIGGVPDLVRTGVTGFLAQPGSVCDFRRGIELLLEDDEAREKMGLMCRNIATKEYSVELQAQRYIELYQALLGSANQLNPWATTPQSSPHSNRRSV